MADKESYNEYLIFTEPAGKKVLKELREKFKRKTGNDPIETHVRSAQADVVDFISRCVETAEKRAYKGE